MGFYLRKSVAVGPFRFIYPAPASGCRSAFVECASAPDRTATTFVSAAAASIISRRSIRPRPRRRRRASCRHPRIRAERMRRCRRSLRQVPRRSPTLPPNSCWPSFARNAQRQRSCHLPAVGSILVLLFAVALPGWALLLLAIAATFTIVAAHRRDVLRKTTVI